MRLAHHPDAVAALRAPTASEPWRVLLSGCLFGLPCGVNGTDYDLGANQPPWFAHPHVQRIPFCPEDHGMGTPRTMPDLHGGDGFAVLDGSARLMDDRGLDVTEVLLAGAEAMLALAHEHEVDFAVLTDRSGLCGSQVISVGCRFEEPVQHRRGVGLATALLLRNGVKVVSQRDFRTLGLLGAKIDPAFAPDSSALDHHNHPWVREHLPLAGEPGEPGEPGPG